MTTTTMDRIQTEAERAPFRPGRAILTGLAYVCWVVGWVGGKALTGLTYAGAAVKVGWQDARRPPKR